MTNETTKNSKKDSLYSQDNVDLPTFEPSQVYAFPLEQAHLFIWEGFTPPSAPNETITLKEFSAIQNFSAFIKNIQDRVSKQPDHNNLSAATGQLICVLSYCLKQIACEKYIEKKIEKQKTITHVKRDWKRFTHKTLDEIKIPILHEEVLKPATTISYDRVKLYDSMMNLGQAIRSMDLLQNNHLQEWAADDNIATLEMSAKIIIRALFTPYLMSNEELQTACKQTNPTTHCYGTVTTIVQQILEMSQPEAKVKSFVGLKEVFRGAYMSQISDSLIIDKPDNLHGHNATLSPVLLKYVIANAIYQQAKKSKMDQLVDLFEKEPTLGMAQQRESFLYENDPEGAEGWLKSICATCAHLAQESGQEWDWQPIADIVTNSDTFSKELVAFFEQIENFKRQNYKSTHFDWEIKYSNQGVTIEIREDYENNLPIREYLRTYPSVFKKAVNQSIPKLLIYNKLNYEEAKYRYYDN